MFLSSVLEFLTIKGIKFKSNFNPNNDLKINKAGDPQKLENNAIYWIKDEEKFSKFRNKDTSKIIFILPLGFKDELKNFISVENPKETFFCILEHFFETDRGNGTIHKSSIVDSIEIGKNVTIGANSYISKNTKIGNNVWIKNNVSIEGNVEIGHNTTISSGCVIGSEGYGYLKNESGILKKVPHYGGVLIGENVEVGANTCIDRGTLGNTYIGDDVKIDNLCHIAHNVIIEKNVNVIAMSMIAGSVTLKEDSYIAPSASVMNQITVGKNSLVGLGAVVVKDVEEDTIVAGVPAKFIKNK